MFLTKRELQYLFKIEAKVLVSLLFFILFTIDDTKIIAGLTMLIISRLLYMAYKYWFYKCNVN